MVSSSSSSDNSHTHILFLPAAVCTSVHICLQDPLQLDAYLASNIFLADINNERENKQPRYADNLAALQRLVLFRFEDDTTGESSRQLHEGAEVCIC